MKYYYPDNLEAPATFFNWSLGNAAMIAISLVFALLIAGFLHFMLPLVAVVVYAFMTIQFEDISIYGYLTKIGSYLISKQQRYYWEVPKIK